MRGSQPCVSNLNAIRVNDRPTISPTLMSPGCTTPSASTWSRCASTTSWCRAPSRCSSSTISRPAGWTCAQASGGDRRHRRGLPRRPAAPWSAARPPRCPGCTRRATTTSPASRSARRSAGRLLPHGGGAGRRGAGAGECGRPSNGFSLVRRIVEASGPRLGAPAPFAPDGTLGRGAAGADAHLCAAAAGAASRRTAEGGGAYHRRRPARQSAARAAGRHRRRCWMPRWPLPPVFGWLARTGGVAAEEMLRVFNCGIGMAVVVRRRRCRDRRCWRPRARRCSAIGRIEAGERRRPRSASTLPDGWPA